MVCTKDPIQCCIRFALVCRSSDWHVQAFSCQRTPFAFSVIHQWPAFAEKGCTPYLQHNAAKVSLHRVQVFHLIPLFSRTRSRVSPIRARSRDCHKNRSNIKFTSLRYPNYLHLSTIHWRPFICQKSPVLSNSCSYSCFTFIALCCMIKKQF